MKSKTTQLDWIEVTQRFLEKSRMAYIEVLHFDDKINCNDQCAEYVDKLLLHVSNVLEDFRTHKEKQL